MNLIINGEVRSFENTITVEKLLKQVGIDSRKVAVERNLERI